MRNTQNQRGMTAIGWLIVLVLVLFFAIVLMKLVPVYIDGYKVYSSLESLEADDSAHGKSPLELRRLLMKRLDINMVTDVGKDDISFSRDRNGTRVEVDYEARRQLFGNMYVVIVFNKAVVVPN
jgi:hypothetical protein